MWLGKNQACAEKSECFDDDYLRARALNQCSRYSTSQVFHALMIIESLESKRLTVGDRIMIVEQKGHQFRVGLENGADLLSPHL
jgi:hypothetical protein